MILKHPYSWIVGFPLDLGFQNGQKWVSKLCLVIESDWSRLSLISFDCLKNTVRLIDCSSPLPLEMPFSIKHLHNSAGKTFAVVPPALQFLQTLYLPDSPSGLDVRRVPASLLLLLSSALLWCLPQLPLASWGASSRRFLPAHFLFTKLFHGTLSGGFSALLWAFQSYFHQLPGECWPLHPTYLRPFLSPCL